MCEKMRFLQMTEKINQQFLPWKVIHAFGIIGISALLLLLVLSVRETDFNLHMILFFLPLMLLYSAGIVWLVKKKKT